MSEREDVIARLEAKGVKVDRRMNTAKLAALDAETDDNEDAELPEERIEVPPSPEPPVEDGWPRRIAPLVWVDRSGRRYTDLGRARAGDEELR